MAHIEYRVIHSLTGVMEPVLMPSKDYAENYVNRIKAYLKVDGEFKIQQRTVTDWEDA